VIQGPRPLLRLAIGGTILLIFAGTLLGILVTGPVVVPQARLTIDFEPSEARLRTDVRRLCEGFQPRDSVDVLHAASNWIASEFLKAGLEVEFQQFEIEGQIYRNVMGVRRGTLESAPAILLGAHYDAEKDSLGANDDASGMAVLLETVRTLQPGSPRYDQYFVAFAGEAEPHAGTERSGSAYLAEALYLRGVEIDLMLSVDRVGMFDAESPQQFPLPLMRWLYPSNRTFLIVAANPANGLAIRRIKQGMLATRALPVYSTRIPDQLVGLPDSAHVAFWNRGLPAALITDGTVFEKPARYNAADLNYEMMAHVVTALHGALWNNGGAPASAIQTLGESD